MANAKERLVTRSSRRGDRTRALPSNRSLESAKARCAGERLEFRVAFLFGKGKAGLGIASLGRFVADQKRDRRSPIARGLSGRERVVDQGLHQPASAIRGQRGDMLDQPIAVATLYPAGGGIGAPLEYRWQFGGIQTGSPATSSIAARAAAPVPAAGNAQSAAAGLPSSSAIRNCDVCHQLTVRASAIRATNARHSASGRFSAMSNQPRGRWPRCAARMVQAMKSASSGPARRIVGVTAAPLRSRSRVLQRHPEIRLRSSTSPRPA